MNSAENESPKVCACFRVMGGGLDPEGISATLALEPDYCHRQGDPRTGKEGRRYSDYKEGIWIINSSADPLSTVEDHLGDLCRKLAGKKDVIEKLMLGNTRLDISVGVIGTGGTFAFSVSHTMIARLAQLGVTLDFDFYSANR